MKLTGLHVLLTYKCTYECDHCFVWGSPQQAGVFTLAQLEDAFQQAASLGSVDTFYFEGGETFIYYPILIKAVERAHSLGFTTGIVTNGYWANNVTDSMAWLRPLVEAGLDKIEISYDQYHGDAHGANAAHPGLLAAGRYGLTASTISIDPPVRLASRSPGIHPRRTTGWRRCDVSRPGGRVIDRRLAPATVGHIQPLSL